MTEKAGRRISLSRSSQQSDEAIVPVKRPNNPRTSGAEGAEGRAKVEGNTLEERNPGAQKPDWLLTKIQRVGEAARRDKNLRLNNLLHCLTPHLLRRSFEKLNPKAAVGVDKRSWQGYKARLWENSEELARKIHTGRYRALPSRRIYIPKEDGRNRPIGIAALEDKIVQQAVVEILNSIYEQDFLGFSYGFRPRRSQHQALDALYVAVTQRKVSWIVDADIRSFFDTLDHEWLMKFLAHRIADRRLLRLVAMWLKAGVLEEQRWSATDVGTPQGAVISPLLANVYLHYVLDLWVEKWRKQPGRGEMYIVRYADDFVMGFQRESDARAMMNDLARRLAKFGMELHGEKTRLIRFGRYAQEQCEKRQLRKPETFDFLGFTHICGRSRSGRFQLRRKTISKRVTRKLKEIKDKLRRMRSKPVQKQGALLRAVLQGYFNYHAVPLNLRVLRRMRLNTVRLWCKSLRRRSHKARGFKWSRLAKLAEQWLPKPKILHPWPSERFQARYAL